MHNVFSASPKLLKSKRIFNSFLLFFILLFILLILLSILFLKHFKFQKGASCKGGFCGFQTSTNGQLCTCDDDCQLTVTCCHDFIPVCGNPNAKEQLPAVSFGKVTLDSIEVDLTRICLLSDGCDKVTVEMSEDGIGQWKAVYRGSVTTGQPIRIDNLTRDKRYFFRAVMSNGATSRPNHIRTIKVGVMTSVKNEEYIIVFQIASLLPFVDYYALVDTGSTDMTLPLVRHFFKNEIDSGKLEIVEMKPVKRHNMGIPRNVALAMLRLSECTYFLKMDADDVAYYEGAKKFVETAKRLPDTAKQFYTFPKILWQRELVSIVDWISRIHEDIVNDESSAFYIHTGQLAKSVYNNRILPLKDGFAQGNWEDEANGKPAEDIYYNGIKPPTILGTKERWHVHYGWARPVELLRKKLHQWTGNQGVEVADKDPSWELEPFGRGHDHPEVFKDYSSKVVEFLNESYK